MTSRDFKTTMGTTTTNSIHLNLIIMLHVMSYPSGP
eukprot:COSAG06_NODE_45942_length_351_cov_0.535714_1_plen_35_part_01